MAQKIKYLVIHCTDTPEKRKVTSDDIRDWHLSPPPRGRGWKQVGYTDMIHLDGCVERMVDNNEDDMVDSWEITNGVAGINYLSRHIVYVGGGKGTDTRTPAQKASLNQYVLDFIKKYPWIKIAGHRQFDKNKSCPGFDVAAWLRRIGVPENNIYS